MMKNSAFPLFYFPTQVMVVDDNKHFLNNLALTVDKNIVLSLHDDPQSAINKLKNCYENLYVLNDAFIKNFNTDEYDTNTSIFNVDFQAIYSQIFSAHRFDQISAVLIDYKMPLITGTDFCQQIQHLPIKKIMLTGEAGYETGIENFNKGHIDMFIVKNSNNMLQQIHTAIYDALRAYFNELSKPIMAALSKENSALFDSIYIEFAENILREKAIVEYYLYDELGSFLLINAEGDITWLAVINENTLNDMYETALDCSLAANTIDSLAKKNKAPFSFKEPLDTMHPSEWSNYMYTITEIAGRNATYFVAQIDVNNVFKEKPMTTYNEYMKQFSNERVDLCGGAK